MIPGVVIGMMPGVIHSIILGWKESKFELRRKGLLSVVVSFYMM